ncbi:hypothetical protein BDA96_04G153300 [Sorghum bicolor]|uniref:Uncharacterized protein n=1 Tax=Sorghum bicolor TaxID=4558 RepID=A0A921UI74_SORBI|nr:hypothetical protein BDA96_04G153300 [Sorghum bicolor]
MDPGGTQAARISGTLSEHASRCLPRWAGLSERGSGMPQLGSIYRGGEYSLRGSTSASVAHRGPHVVSMSSSGIPECVSTLQGS